MLLAATTADAQQPERFSPAADGTRRVYDLNDGWSYLARNDRDPRYDAWMARIPASSRRISTLRLLYPPR